MLVVLIILYVGSQVGSTLLMSATADKNQRRLFLALPLVFVVFIINFPAGLIVYWITTNFWTIGQQYIVKRTVGPVKPAPVGAATSGAAALKAGGGGGGSSDRGDGEKEGDSGGGLLARLARSAGVSAPANGGADGGGNGSGNSKGAAKAPPPSPRKKKKRSGRRR